MSAGRPRPVLASVVLVFAPVWVSSGNAEAARGSDRAQENLERQVRKELVKLPDYSVFDNLEFRVEGYRVELRGQVLRGSLKSSAEKVVRRIEGVEGVTNNIEVLPASVHDDRLRRAVFNAIYSRPPLQRYAVQAVPPIHIIVNHGHVTLVGVVATEAEKSFAYAQARGVSGSFSVTNRLQVET
ncbi:MAG: BON domain-containing protein [Candidatus Acidiferrales bacterium]